MQRLTILGVCLLTATVMFATPGMTSESEFEMRVPMGTLVLEPPSSVEPKRSNVKFPHSKHFIEISCNTCHHSWNGTDTIQSCMTSSCHDLSVGTRTGEVKIKSKTTPIKYYKKAYHNQCLGCHKTLNEKVKKMEDSKIKLDDKIPSTGPTGCIECHPK